LRKGRGCGREKEEKEADGNEREGNSPSGILAEGMRLKTRGLSLRNSLDQLSLKKKTQPYVGKRGGKGTGGGGDFELVGLSPARTLWKGEGDLVVMLMERLWGRVYGARARIWREKRFSRRSLEGRGEIEWGDGRGEDFVRKERERPLRDLRWGKGFSSLC